MRIPSSYHNADISEQSSMTPMIDVVFLLLIFFVCASVGQVHESLLPTKLAAGAVASQIDQQQPKPLGEVWLYLKRTPDEQTVVQVNRGGQEYKDFDRLRETLFGLAELGREEIPIILDIAPDVPLGDMIRVYDTCRAAQFRSIHFATSLKSETVKPPKKPAR